MLRNVIRRFTASALAAGVLLMALSACASGAMTMSEMVCCVEHHDACDLEGMAESCCGMDQQAHDVGVLKPERADDTQAQATQALLASTSLPPGPGLAWCRSRADLTSGRLFSPPRSHVLFSVFLI